MTVTVTSRQAAPHTVFAMSATSATSATRRRSLATRTGLRLCAAVIAVSILTLGLWTYLGTTSSDSALEHAATQGAPLTVAAEDVYRGLSDADATAAAVFLSGSQAQTGGLQRYQADLQQVSAGLSALGAQAGATPALHAAVSQLVADLPEYADVVGTAQADARQDLPVGAAYLREASGLMRSKLLPSAQRIVQVQTAGLAADADAGRGPQAEVVLTGLALAALCLVQVFLARRTRRLLNPGLVAATSLLLITGVWAGAAAGYAGSASAAAHSRRHAADALITTDLTVLRAHGDELLNLAARGEDAGSYENDFKSSSTQLASMLAADRGTAIADVTTGYQQWMTAHAALVQAVTSPQPDNTANIKALAEATGAQPGTGTLFAGVDGDLRGAATAEESAFSTAVATGRSDLHGLADGTVALIVPAALCGAFGINRRLREYR